MNYHKYRIIVPFLTLPLSLYIVFVMIPYIRSILISFTRWRGLTPNGEWVGLANYQTLIQDPNFWNALGNNIVYLIAIPVVTMIIALGLAALLTTGNVPFSNFYRVIFFFPQVMSIVAIGVLWSFVYHPRMGILNGVLSLFGVDEVVAWLGNPNLAVGAIAVVVVWQTVGFHMVLFIAGIGSIPRAFYESAEIDGANGWHVLWKITLPLLNDTMRTSLLFMSIGAFNMFAITQTMTQGGPNRATDVLATYVYERAFVSSRFGYATAIAVSMFLIMLAFSVFTTFFTRSENLEY